MAPVSPEVVIMDGSMGRQLCLDGMPQDDLFRQIWSARALVDEALHGLVVAAHRSYIDAGSSLLITNAYGVQPTFYRRAFPEDWEARMLRDAEIAARLAVQARAESGAQNVRIFGCLPPLAESHRPDCFRDFVAREGEDFVVGTFRALGEAALRGGADGLILENMVSWEEASLALRGAGGLGAPLILSMEGALRSLEREPEPSRAPEVARLTLKAKRAGMPIEALGFSCTEPETILECLKAIDAAEGLRQEMQEAGLRLSAHANCNDRKEAHAKGFDVRADKSGQIKVRADLVYDNFNGYVGFCRDYARHGVTYIGGCCGCGPHGIREIASALGGSSQGAAQPSPAAAVDSRTLAAAKALAPTGVLRAGINLANTMLVTGEKGPLQPEGVAPSLAAEIARRLRVDVRYVPFKTPAELADAAGESSWDIGLIGADPKRAEKLAFTAPYVEIPASYCVLAGSPLAQVGDVDKEGVRIASFAGTAYGLWLERNLKCAKLVQTTSRSAAVELLRERKVEALAGVKQHLLEDAAGITGATVLDGSFMTVQQAVGFSQGLGPEAQGFLEEFVEEAKASGLVAGLLERHGVADRLAVAPPAAPIDGSGDAKRRRVGGKGLKIAVLGCGAMGSVYAAFLAGGGHDVHVVDVWKEHVEAIRERGLRVEGPAGDRTVRIKAATDANEVEPSDLVIIATKASGVGDAAKIAARLVKDDGAILTIQNGLGAGDRIAEHIDPAKVLLGIASNFGASMKGPGHAETKNMNKICIGELTGGLTERLDRVVRAWSDSGFNAEGAVDIHAQIWEKLICNCTYSGPCTVTGMTVGEVQDNLAAWNIALSCAREADAVARARGIKLSWDDVEAHVRKFGSTVRGARPSMLQDRLARRRSEIDAINGAIPREAAKVGMAAPANQTVADTVRALEASF